MPESSDRRTTIAAGLVGLACIALAGWAGGVLAAVAGWIAQPAFAIAVRAKPVAAGAPLRHARDLLLLWGLALAGAALLMAWPLATAGGDPISLANVLATSALAGIGLIVLWRLWPLWQGLERRGGRLGERWRDLPSRDAGAWRGLGAALLVAVPLVSVLLIAWPDTLAATTRWMVAA